ncbi:MAG: DUF3105 domain-containing protein [Candidatus Liptonbacteria bacterium]|nr:DUF3105 domain-containing protein [Candidatus Liptonbacteria bacterium]
MDNTQIKGTNLKQEASREIKQSARELAEKREKLKKITKRALWLFVAAGIAYLLVTWIVGQFPKGPDYSRSFHILGREHISPGSPRPEYNSDPPTSGPHHPNPADVSFYSKELPDEQLVHNLEHGHVWISYRSDLSQEVVDKLKGFAGGSVIVTMRLRNDSDIALAAWGRLDKFNLESGPFPAQRIKDFILRYQNRGPENPNLPSHFRQ